MDEQKIWEIADECCDYGGNVEPIRFARRILAAQAESGEPVAWMIQHEGQCMGFLPFREKGCVPVFLHPQQQSADVAELVDALRRTKEALEEHGGNYKLSKAGAKVVNDAIDVADAALAKHGGK